MKSTEGPGLMMEPQVSVPSPQGDSNPDVVGAGKMLVRGGVSSLNVGVPSLIARGLSTRRKC